MSLSSRPFRLLPMTLFPVRGSRGMRATKIRPVMVAVRAPAAAGTTSVTAKIGAGLLLSKMSRG
jgi:hypothetical protein